MDLIKQAQSACRFPEFREEEKHLVAKLGRYLALLPEPSRRDWLAIAAMWVLVFVAAVVLATLPVGAMIDSTTQTAPALFLLAALATFIVLGALYILLTVRLSALQTPEIFAVQQQITEHGARIALMFRAYRKGVVSISHALLRHLKSCARIRTKQMETAQNAIEALFAEIRPDANEAKRNRKTKTKVPRESDYTLTISSAVPTARLRRSKGPSANTTKTGRQPTPFR